jgi:hypothetical protein
VKLHVLRPSSLVASQRPLRVPMASRTFSPMCSTSRL